MTAGFPTLGEVVKYSFKATGIISSKYEHAHSLSDKEKKKYQKALERLAAEEGNINKSFQELGDVFITILSTSIKNRKVLQVISDVIGDLVLVYGNVITDDGTYQDTKGSLRWILSTHFIPRLVISLHKHPARINLASEALISPAEPYWFFPTTDDNSVTWPLGKAMTWVYQLSGMNQTQFHYPSEGTKSNDHLKANQLDSAQNWITGKHIPSWEALQRNFMQALEAYPHLAEQKESILLTLFVARVATVISQDIDDLYGRDFLNELIAQFKRHTDWLKAPLMRLSRFFAEIAHHPQIPSEMLDCMHADAVDRFWCERADLMAYATSHIQSVIMESPHILSAEQRAWFVNHYGEDVVGPAFEFFDRQQKREHIPEGFIECLAEFLELKKTSCEPSEVARFIAKVDSYQLSSVCAWMVPWLRAETLCHANDWSGVYRELSIAFEAAKYAAGQNQRPLLNHYLEACAKNNKWREFKKGVAWAQYLGIKVRVLGQDEPSDDNMRYVFDMMQRAYIAW
ncbi:hypothetical protein JD488_02050 [Aeromonas jandaei]|uniref:hypothetical protein n=1 Tax=Aeromonas jandaei TaxID=650 RepID=UPI00191CE45C|nr:hypothetical protein [Aeromonas jandaei]MBL0665490.1 hypothetical protein [Aeromonas jandaei]